MKIYRLPELADLNPGGDFLLGAEELGTDAISILYGRISHGGPPRRVSAGDGRHAVLFVISGQMSVALNRHTFEVSGGEAFAINGTDEVCLENSGERESVYVLTSSGRSAEAPAGERAPQPSSVVSPGPCTGQGPDDPEEPDTSYGAGPEMTYEAGLDETEFEITRDDANPGDGWDEGR